MGRSRGVPDNRADIFFINGEGNVSLFLEGKMFVGNSEGFKSFQLRYNGDIIQPYNAAPYGKHQYLILHPDGKLYLWNDDFSVCKPLDVFPQEESIFRVWSTESGRCWVHTRHGLYSIENETPTIFLGPTSLNFEISSIVEDSTLSGYAMVTYPPDMFGIWNWKKNQKPIHTKEGIKHRILSLEAKNSFNPIYAYNFGEVRTFNNNRWSTIYPLPNEMSGVLSFKYRKNGDLWVATESRLNLLRSSNSLWSYLKQNTIKENMIGELLLTRKGDLWVGADSGLVIYQSDGNVRHIMSILGQTLTAITGLAEDTEGNIWVSSGMKFIGAYKWDGSAWSYFGVNQGLPCLVHKIVMDRDGKLWFLGLGKYYDVDNQDPGAFVYSNRKFIRWGKKEGLPHNRVYSFAQSIDGAYWFGTNGGLSRWKQGTWTHWNMSTGLLADRIFSLAIDSSNTVWFSHQFKGFGYLQEEKPQYVTLEEDQYVDAVWQISIDSVNTVWATTTNGLISIDHGVISRYSENMGLSPTRLWPIIPTRDKIYMGTFGGGVVIMNRNAMDDTPPTIVLSQPAVEKKSALFRWQAYSYMGQQEMRSIKTRFRLDNDQWSEWTEQREKLYLDLPPGSHTFTVQARNSIGKVVPMGVSTVITLELPYYLQSYYLIPISILSGGLIILVVIILLRKRKHDLELRLSEERYRGIIQDQTDLLCRISLNDRLLFVNEAFCSYFNTTVVEAVGKKFQDFVSEKREEYEPVKELSLENPTRSFNNEIRLANGGIRWLNVIERAFFDEVGGIVEVQWVARDISGLKKMNDALRQSEKDYRGLFENAHDAIIIFDPDNEIIIDANQNACEMYQIHRTVFIGSSLEQITHNNTWSKEQIRETLNRGYCESFETVHSNENGSTLYIDVNASVVNYKGKSVILSIHRDITDRKLSELAILKREAILEALSFAGQQFIGQGELEFKIQEVIVKLGLATGVSRVYIVENSIQANNEIVGKVKNSWASEEAQSNSDILLWKELHYVGSGLIRWLTTLGNGETILGHINEFSEPEQKMLSASGVKSILMMPIMVNKSLWGVIGYDDCKQKRSWSSAEIDALSVTANILGSVVERQIQNRIVNMLAQSIKGISECVCITDLENKFIFVNGAFCATYGYEESELIGASVEIIRSYDTSVLTSQILPATLSGGWQGELFNKKKDGTVFPIYLSTSTVKDDTGSSIALIGIAKDITEQKRIERHLREQASLLSITTDAIIVTDIDQLVTYWNPGAERLYGWDTQSVIGQNLNTLFDTTTIEVAHQKLDTLLEAGEWRGELKQKTKLDKEIIVDSRAIVIRDEYSLPISILIVNTDITEKKLMQEQFLRSQRLESIGTLAGGIAHDLNNVLTPILLSIDILKKRVKDEGLQDLLNSLRTSTTRGKEIIKQVLTFARGVGGEYADLQPNHLLQEVENLMHETFPKMLNIRIIAQNDLWKIMGDSTQLHQVLLNLCLNARDAMPLGGSIILNAVNVHVDREFVKTHLNAKEGKYVSISVSDMGTGIAPETLDKIFDPFFTTKDIGKGTGLGLSTVHAIIKGHGGFVTVQSKEGQGSTFTVYLPVAEKEIDFKTITKEPTSHKGKDECILVVDDEVAILEIARQTLEYSGYRVLTAEEGTEAIALYLREQNDIQLVLTDIHMPYMDGISLIRSLRQITPSLKILVASGHGADSRFLGDTEVMIQGFIPKPYTAGDLLEAIHNALQ